MNKSKFLKKSLAMILSVLMIVAMIPLGASAANSNVTNDLASITVGTTTVPVSNGVFKADVSQKNVKIVVTGLYSGETAKVVKADGINTVTVSGSGDTLDLDEYTVSGNVYTIPLVLTSEDGKNTANYTIQLTKVAARTTAELASVKVEKAFNATISGRVINVTVPLNYSNQFDMILTPKDGATITGAASQGDGTYKLTGFNGSEEITVTSESTGNVNVYTLNLVEVPVLDAFQAGDVAAKIDHDAETITATYPASVLVIPNTELVPPAKAMATTFSVPAGTEVKLNGTKIGSGKAQDYWNGSDGFKAADDLVLTVDYEGVTKDYKITFNTELDTANSILAASVDGETATISGSSISAIVQTGATGNLDVELVSSPSAKISIASSAGTALVTDHPADAVNGDGNGVFTMAVDTNELKAGVVVVVTSQAGKNKQYELKIKATGEVDTTELTSFAIRTASGTYTGTVNKNARTVNVTVPYLTTDAQLKAAKVIATTNAYVKAAKADGTKIDTVEDLGITAITPNSNATSGTATGTLYAKAKYGSNDADTQYTVTVTLETAKAGNTLSSLVATSANTYKTLSSDNTYTGMKKTDADGNSSVTISPAYSEVKAGNTSFYLKTLTTANGGVAFMGSSATTITTNPVPGQLDSTKTATTPQAAFVTLASSTANGNKYTGNISGDKYIIVLPEIEARKQLNQETPDVTKGTVYELKIESQAAKSGTSLSSIKFGTTTLSNALTGTVPYGLTVANGESTFNTTNTHFADEINLSVGATATVWDTDGAKIGDIVAGGDTDGNGEADPASATNVAFIFERQDNGTVLVYGYTGAKSSKPIGKVVVLAEDGKTQWTYNMGTIKFAQPNTEAQITAFSVAGAAGSIKNEGYDNWTITVTVPLGTKLTNLVPTFTASAGATVYDGSNALTSGESALNFSEAKVLTVVSEDKGKTNTYTVKVTAAESFVDVPANAWYYNNVMAAYNAGLVSGTGNGKFEPNANISRRDFAILVYKLLGSPTPESTVSFKDVAADDYAATAIATLKEKDIVSGDADTGNFRPAASISRQEAACIVANALSLTGSSTSKFNDDAKIASWASAKVYACYAAGVLSGDKDTGNFRPTANITRAEAASIILNASSK